MQGSEYESENNFAFSTDWCLGCKGNTLYSHSVTRDTCICGQATRCNRPRCLGRNDAHTCIICRKEHACRPVPGSWCVTCSGYVCRNCDTGCEGCMDDGYTPCPQCRPGPVFPLESVLFPGTQWKGCRVCQTDHTRIFQALAECMLCKADYLNPHKHGHITCTFYRCGAFVCSHCGDYDEKYPLCNVHKENK